MNPCISCIYDKDGCHKIGFADKYCDDWVKWKTELSIFKAQSKLDAYNLRKKLMIEEENNE